MISLTILISGLLIVGMFNLKIRQISLTLLSLLLFNKKFRRIIFLLIKLSFLSIHKRNSRRRVLRISKKFINKKLGIAI
jgi:hypothetical protein